MNRELKEFILELIEEIDHLQCVVDGEISVNLERSDRERELQKESYLKILKGFEDES